MARSESTKPAATVQDQPDEPRPAWWPDWLRLRDLLSSSKVPEARVLSKELAAKWPESETLQHYARVLEPPVVRRLPQGKPRDFGKDYAWIREHGHEYPGYWLAIYEGRLVAADLDMNRVLAAIREAGLGGLPFLHHQKGAKD
jgi:hypothetical protein